MQTDFSQSLAVTNINCLVYKFDWISPFLDEEFGLQHLHPNFEAALNGILKIQSLYISFPFVQVFLKLQRHPITG
jgi:hypothetical protein